MKDENKTKEQLLKELTELRHQMAVLEATKAKYKEIVTEAKIYVSGIENATEGYATLLTNCVRSDTIISTMVREVRLRWDMLGETTEYGSNATM